MSNRRLIRVAMAGLALALVCLLAVAETTGTEDAATTATGEAATIAPVATAEEPATVPVRQVIRIPEGMEQRWTRMEAAGRAAGLSEDELARLLDLESKAFLARAAGDADAERRAVSERRSLLTPARWRALRDELRRQAVPDTTPGGAAAETTAPATEAAESVTTAP